MKKEEIKLSKPQPYEEVGGEGFLVSGWISKSLLFSDSGVDNRIFLDILGIGGQNWRSGEDVDIKFDFFSIFKKICDLVLYFISINQTFLGSKNLKGE